MRIKTVLIEALVYLRGVLLIDVAISLLVAFTFLFTKNFSFLVLSERIFWAGLGITLIGGLVAFAATFSGRNFGIPTIIRKPEEAKNLLDHFQEYRVEIDKRHDTSIRLFIVGVGCIAFSALIQMLLS